MNEGSFLENLGIAFYIVNPERTSFETADEVPNYFVQVLPIITFLIFLEHWLLLYQRKTTLRLNDAITSISLGLVMMLSRIAYRSVQLTMFTLVYNNWRLITLPWDSVWTWIICFLGADFSFYWWHRALHEINILWAAHQVHHSSEDYNITTALRQPMIQYQYIWIFHIPLALFIPPSLIIVHNQLSLLYQVWIHTQTISSLGPLEYVLNTPSHHRVHHGRNRYCIDKNYGATLIIWDRMFGTFQAEKEEVLYGLTHNVNSFETFYLQLFHYWHIWRTFWKTTGFCNKLSVIFKGPGWSPGTPWCGNIEDIPDVKSPEKKYDPHVNVFLEMYVGVHFFSVIYTFMELVLNKQSLPAIIFWCTVTFEVLSLSIFGMLLEGRSYSKWFEFMRCSLYGPLDYFFLPHTTLFRHLPQAIYGVRAFFISCFTFWLVLCIKSVLGKATSNTAEKNKVLMEKANTAEKIKVTSPSV